MNLFDKILQKQKNIAHAFFFEKLLQRAENLRTKILDGSAGTFELNELQTLKNSFLNSIMRAETDLKFKQDLTVEAKAVAVKDIAILSRICLLLEQTYTVVWEKTWLTFNQVEWLWFETELKENVALFKNAGDKKVVL